MILDIYACTRPFSKLDLTGGVRKMLRSCETLRPVHSHGNAAALPWHAFRSGPHYKCSSCRAAMDGAC